MKASRRFALYSMNMLVGLIADACLANTPVVLVVAIVVVVLMIAIACFLFVRFRGADSFSEFQSTNITKEN